MIEFRGYPLLVGLRRKRKRRRWRSDGKEADKWIEL
jgi:hypothetical protein